MTRSDRRWSAGAASWMRAVRPRPCWSRDSAVPQPRDERSPRARAEYQRRVVGGGLALPSMSSDRSSGSLPVSSRRRPIRARDVVLPGPQQCACAGRCPEEARDQLRRGVPHPGRPLLELHGRAGPVRVAVLVHVPPGDVEFVVSPGECDRGPGRAVHRGGRYPARSARSGWPRRTHGRRDPAASAVSAPWTRAAASDERRSSGLGNPTVCHFTGSRVAAPGGLSDERVGAVCLRRKSPPKRKVPRRAERRGAGD